MKTQNLIGLGILVVVGLAVFGKLGGSALAPVTASSRADALLQTAREALAKAQADQAAFRAGRNARIASGTAEGASVGAVAGPWGIGVGAAAGAFGAFFEEA